jgi:PTH1 family peptidyl-tRNA hydrolase
MVVDLLARELKLKFHRYQSYLRAGAQGGLVLIKPLVYINNSGPVVARVRERNRAEDFIIVCDDLSLLLGRIRIRPAGGDGGHQGLSSIIQALGTEQFPRLRLGIGPPTGDWVQCVLSQFLPEELEIVKEMLIRATQAVLLIRDEGLEVAMNRYNPE